MEVTKVHCLYFPILLTRQNKLSEASFFLVSCLHLLVFWRDMFQSSFSVFRFHFVGRNVSRKNNLNVTCSSETIMWRESYSKDFSREDSSGCIVNADAIPLPEQHNTDQFTLRDQFKMPRPCYYTLRFLGAWQPRNCHWLCDLYSMFSYVILLVSMFAILGRYLSLYWKHAL